MMTTEEKCTAFLDWLEAQDTSLLPTPLAPLPRLQRFESDPLETPTRLIATNQYLDENEYLGFRNHWRCRNHWRWNCQSYHRLLHLHEQPIKLDQDLRTTNMKIANTRHAHVAWMASSSRLGLSRTDLSPCVTGSRHTDSHTSKTPDCKPILPPRTTWVAKIDASNRDVIVNTEQHDTSHGKQINNNF